MFLDWQPERLRNFRRFSKNETVEIHKESSGMTDRFDHVMASKKCAHLLLTVKACNHEQTKSIESKNSNELRAPPGLHC